MIPTMSHPPSLPALRFGWNNSDNPPKDYHFHVSEAEIPDYFEGASSIEELQWRARIEPLQPTETVIKKAINLFKDTKSPRLFMLEIPDALGLSTERVESYYANLLQGLLRSLQSTEPWDKMRLKSLAGSRFFINSQSTGMSLANYFNTEMAQFLAQFKEDKHRTTSLHWDVALNSLEDPTGNKSKTIPFLALLHGERQNLKEDSALNLMADFNQWYEDQDFEKALESLSEEEVGLLLLEHSQQIEDKYMITIPANKKSKRLTLVSNTPQYGGLFHGVTLPVLISPDKEASRAIKQAFIIDSNTI